jgi:hypothetical protein
MHRLQQGLLQAGGGFLDDHQRLLAGRRSPSAPPAPAHGQLVDPGLRHRVAACGRNDAGIGRALGHSPACHRQKAGAHWPAGSAAGWPGRLFMQAAQPLNAVDLGRQLAQHRGLVAAAGADFQHPAQSARGITPLPTAARHARHHVGFGDGLPQPMGRLVSS